MSSATSCHTHHNMTELSFFSSSISSLLLLLTVPSNAFVIVALLSNKKMLKKSAFHKILLNIAVADLFTGLVSDPTSISFHTKEGLKQSISTHEVKLLHCSLFLFNTASVLTMALLCVDRMVAIKFPFKYRLGLSNTKSALLTAGVWAVAGLLLIPYFSMGYIKYLTVFSFATVAIAFVSLVLFVVVYRKKFNVRPETRNTSNAVSLEANPPKKKKIKASSHWCQTVNKSQGEPILRNHATGVPSDLSTGMRDDRLHELVSELSLQCHPRDARFDLLSHSFERVLSPSQFHDEAHNFQEEE